MATTRLERATGGFVAPGPAAEVCYEPTTYYHPGVPRAGGGAAKADGCVLSASGGQSSWKKGVTVDT